jgi:hypothetical protein
VDEVNVEPVDVGDEVGVREDLRLGAAPVVVVRPIVGDLLHRPQPHALRIVADGFPVGPFGRQDPPLQIGELSVGRMIFERPDRRVAGGHEGTRLADQ